MVFKMNEQTDKNLTDKSSIEEWILNKGEYRIRHKEIVKEFHPVLRKFIIKDEKITWLHPSERGYVKRIEYSIILIRHATSTETLQPVKGYFLRKYIAEVPNAKPYKYIHLKLSEATYYKKRFKRGGLLHCDFDGMVSQILEINDPDYTTKISTSRIPLETVNQLLRECKVLGIYEESDDGKLRTCASFRKYGGD